MYCGTELPLPRRPVSVARSLSARTEPPSGDHGAPPEQPEAIDLPTWESEAEPVLADVDPEPLEDDEFQSEIVSSLTDQLESSVGDGSNDEPDDGLEVGVSSAEVPKTEFVETVASDLADERIATERSTRTSRRGPSHLIGAPPLRPRTALLDVIMSPPVHSGFIGWMYYGVAAPQRAQRQRDVIQAIGTHLAKLKKQEQELVVAIGRAARIHGLAPDGTGDLVQASQAQELQSRDERLKAQRKAQEHVAAEREYKTSVSKGESQLAGLENKKAGLSARLEAVRSALAQAEQQVEQLARREQELRRPSKRGLSEEEVAHRVQEFEAIKAQRKIAEMDVETARDQVRAAERPVNRIEGEISVVQGELKGAEERLTAAEDKARAAVVSGERRKAKAEVTVAGIDEEIGRHVIGSSDRPDALGQLLASFESAGRLVDQWDEVLHLQQAQLDQYDEKRARTGFLALTGFVLGVLFLLFVGGEMLRRLLS